jgi:chromosome segregation ATPase
MTIQNLKKEIERAWKMVEASHEKEQRAKETIHNLKAEITNLNSLVEQGAGLSVNQENTVNSLISQRDELLRTRDKLETTTQKMTQDNVALTETVQKHESEKLQGEVEIINLRDMLNAKKTEADREFRRRQRLEKELSELKSTLENRQRTLRTIQNGIKEQEEQKEVYDKSLKEQKWIVE